MRVRVRYCAVRACVKVHTSQVTGESSSEDEDDKKKLEELKAEFEPLSKLMKEVLGDKVGKVVVSFRMADSPCGLTTSGLQTWSVS